MADSAADRVRRSRAHKAGNHSLCRPDRCTAAAATEHPAGNGQAPDPGPIEMAVRELASAVSFAPGDPRAAMTSISARLAAAVDETGSASAARELRAIL